MDRSARQGRFSSRSASRQNTSPACSAATRAGAHCRRDRARPFAPGVTLRGRHACDAFCEIGIATPPTALESIPVGHEREARVWCGPGLPRPPGRRVGYRGLRHAALRSAREHAAKPECDAQAPESGVGYLGAPRLL